MKTDRTLFQRMSTLVNTTRLVVVIIYNCKVCSSRKSMIWMQDGYPSGSLELSSYVLDNVKIDEILYFDQVPIGSIQLNESTDPVYYLSNNSKPVNNKSISLFETNSFPVWPNITYNYIMTTKNLFFPVVLFGNSQDVFEYEIRYGNNASNGKVLE